MPFVASQALAPYNKDDLASILKGQFAPYIGKFWYNYHLLIFTPYLIVLPLIIIYLRMSYGLL